MDTKVEFNNPDFQKTLWNLRNSFNDATIIFNSGKNRLPCHKIVLASASEIWSEQLRLSSEIDLGDVSSMNAHLLMKFIYLGKVKVESQEKDVLLELGQKFSIKGLQRVRTLSSDSSDAGNKTISSRTILELPPEILMNILSRLTTHDLLVNVALVSKYFYNLTKDPGVHISVLLPFNVELEPAANFLRFTSKIQELTIFTHEDSELQLKPKLFTSVPEQQHLCDELLVAVAWHTNLKVVDVSGLQATASTFSSLNVTHFFDNLEQLSLCIKLRPDTLDRLKVENTLFIISHIQKLTHLKLRGISSIDSTYVLNTALLCESLESLITDCQLNNEQQVIIYRERKNTLKHLDVNSVSWDEEIFVALSQCQKIDKLTEYIYPFFEGVNKLNKLRAIHLEFRHDQDLEIVKKTFTESVLPQIESIGLTTFKDEAELYPLIARGCPNVKVLYMCSSNEKIGLETLQDMIHIYSKLEIVIVNLEFDRWRFNISDLFVNGAKNLKKLEYVGFDFGMSPRSELKKLLRMLPSLICASYKRDLYFRPTESIETVVSFEKHFEFFNKIGLLQLDGSKMARCSNIFS